MIDEDGDDDFTMSSMYQKHESLNASIDSLRRSSAEAIELAHSKICTLAAALNKSGSELSPLQSTGKSCTEDVTLSIEKLKKTIPAAIEEAHQRIQRLKAMGEVTLHKTASSPTDTIFSSPSLFATKDEIGTSLAKANPDDREVSFFSFTPHRQTPGDMLSPGKSPVPWSTEESSPIIENHSLQSINLFDSLRDEAFDIAAQRDNAITPGRVALTSPLHILNTTAQKLKDDYKVAQNIDPQGDLSELTSLIDLAKDSSRLVQLELEEQKAKMLIHLEVHKTYILHFIVSEP